ncbi:uncharacterized protein LOC143279699 [Babylonia areolata]|uniref:uncharacterized protein LOC143279699 n=1 Tax=Babylonia areolata TaxID=304850 RepID=UPI003FD56A2D
MGCENSKTVRVQPVGPASVSRDNTKMVEGKEGATQTPEVQHRTPNSNGKTPRRGSSMKSAHELQLDDQGNKVKKLRKKGSRSPNSKDLMGSCDSLEDTRSLDSDRGFSATSKQSADSGLGEEYSHVITEFSEQDKVKEVESSFRPRDDLELAITGTTVGTKNSAKDRARLEEAQVMQNLREEGLISKPKAQATGGMCFEIVDARGDGQTRPPPRLEKLALERSRKKKRAVTEDEIREKLERAERRRKKKEQERLEKLRDMERTDALAALENFAQYQKSKEETLAQRMDQAQDNKERQQRELREKQERRRRHAEEVRKRKALAKETGSSQDGEYPEDVVTSTAEAEGVSESVTSRRSPMLVAESSH